jgi:hypothetical protein
LVGLAFSCIAGKFFKMRAGVGGTMPGASVDAELLTFVGLLVIVAVVYVGGMTTMTLDTFVHPVRLRLLSFLGFLATAAILFLGGIWPSYYTIVAILVLPAFLILGILVFRPQLILKRSGLRIYLAMCVVLSALSWVLEIIWLVHVHAK